MVDALKKHRTAIACAVVALGLIPAVAGIQALAHVNDKAALDTLHDPAGPKRIALVIANADYPDADTPLAASVVSDASAMADSLRKRGFEVDFEQNLTKATMTQVVDGFVAKAKPGVTALVAFSGYGIQSNRVNYLIPTDSQIWNERDVRRYGTNLSNLLVRLGEKGADHTIAIVDASRRNPFERRFRPVSAGLAAVEPPRDTLVMSTNVPGRTSDESEDLGRPLRTLSDAMNAPHSDAEALFDTAKQRISVASKGREVPTVSSAFVQSFTF